MNPYCDISFEMLNEEEKIVFNTEFTKSLTTISTFQKQDFQDIQEQIWRNIGELFGVDK